MNKWLLFSCVTKHMSHKSKIKIRKDVELNIRAQVEEPGSSSITDNLSQTSHHYGFTSNQECQTSQHEELWPTSQDSWTRDQAHQWSAAAAPAAKLLQSCPTLWDPIDGSPPGSAIPRILQARTLKLGCHFLLQCVKVKNESEVAQSCPTLWDSIDGSPPGSAIPRILQARTLKWVAISFSNAWKWKMKVKSLSRVRLFTTPWTAAYQAPPSMGFSRQEYWSGVPLPFPCQWSNIWQITVSTGINAGLILVPYRWLLERNENVVN